MVRASQFEPSFLGLVRERTRRPHARILYRLAEAFRAKDLDTLTEILSANL
jgi:hypothetical protein